MVAILVRQARRRPTGAYHRCDRCRGRGGLLVTLWDGGDRPTHQGSCVGCLSAVERRSLETRSAITLYPPAPPDYVPA